MKTLSLIFLLIVLMLLQTEAAFSQPLQWRFVDSLQISRLNFSALYIGNNKILVMGGITESSISGVTATCELISVDNGKVSLAASMPISRAEFPALLTKDSNVVAIGGLSESINHQGPITGQVDMYNRTTNRWITLGSLLIPRRQSSAIFLDDERILVTGGRREDLTSYVEAEIFNIRTGQSVRAADYLFPVNSAISERSMNGDILVYLGRILGPDSWRDTSVISYNPITNTFQRGSKLPEQIHYPTVTKLWNGRTLMVGGSLVEGKPYIVTAAITLETSNATYSKVASLPEGRQSHQTCQFNSDSIIVMGGVPGRTFASNVCTWYNLVDNTVSAGPSFNNARGYYVAVSAPVSYLGGVPTQTKIFAIGGYTAFEDGVVLRSVEVLERKECISSLLTINAGSDISICQDADSVLLQASALKGKVPRKVQWIPKEGLACDTCLATKAHPSETTHYSILAVDSLGCSARDTMIFNIIPRTLHFHLPDTSLDILIDSVYALPVEIRSDNLSEINLGDSIVITLEHDSTVSLYADSVLKGSALEADWTVTYDRDASSFSRTVFIARGTSYAKPQGAIIIPYFQTALSQKWKALYDLKVEIPKQSRCVTTVSSGTSVDIHGCVLPLRPVHIGSTVLGLHSISPNPASDGEVRIVYGTGLSAETDIRLYNTEGRQVQQLLNGAQQEGIHSLQFSTENLPSGIYRCVMKTADRVYSLPLQIIR